MSFWKFIKNQATEDQPESVELRIEGDIVDDSHIWLYEWFDEPAAPPNSFRKELKEWKGKDITVWIDTYGGDVFAGNGIYNALKEHDGKVTVKVDGKAMSAGSLIAMAGDEIWMSPVAVMMIHNPMTGVYGDMHEFRKVAEELDTIKNAILNAYVSKTGRSIEELSTMLDDETYMSANVAVKEGFADGVLYQDEPLNVENRQGISFNRLAVMNSAHASIKKAMKLISKKDHSQIEKDKLLLELELI